ncbi:M12 family metallopeptidase [Elizabethkingia ursingii]|uniref:M12 family metallopeptidase n=1 Tax=Elizabethkingia ursingii TaxID=1756150 RepID=UPI002012A0E7|nr:M12 family metallopeptidase [Elizabethkingia ursingii]MCL1666543.1 M12 family metallopeptidase [Elizabethkingia ursingii]
MKNVIKFLFLTVVMYSCQPEPDEPMFIIDPDLNLASPAESELLKFPSGATVKKMGSDYLWLGDILLSPSQLEEVKSKGYISGILQMSDKAVANTAVHPVTNMPLDKISGGVASVGIGGASPAKTWAMVRYVYAPDLSPDRKQIIREAIAHWEANTNVRFYNATGQPTKHPQFGFDYPYIEFVNGTANNSYVGLIGGRQIVNLAASQAVRPAIHEIGHAIGFFHEQSEPNRDDYMNINFSNIKPEAKNNFDKISSNYFQIGSVDFNSIMMYGSNIRDTEMVYNVNIPTMTRKDGTTWEPAQTLSSIDKMWANRFYLPYIARSDVYRELADVVYTPDNKIMSQEERLALQAQLNNGNPNPPAGGRIPNIH